MVSQKNTPEGEILLERLKLWSELLIRIQLRKDGYYNKLAEAGIVLRSSPTIDENDRPNIIKIKEKLLLATAERDKIIREMARVGGELIDETNWEFLFPGGPNPGSYLSWMPGEPEVSWWRENNDVSSPRMRLKGKNGTGYEPTSH